VVRLSTTDPITPTAAHPVVVSLFSSHFLIHRETYLKPFPQNNDMKHHFTQQTQFQNVPCHVHSETNAPKVKPALITHLAIVTYHRRILSIVGWAKQKRRRNVGNLVRAARIRSVVLDKLGASKLYLFLVVDESSAHFMLR